MGALFSGSQVRWAPKTGRTGLGRFRRTATAQANGVSGAVYSITYFLIEFDAWPGVLVAVGKDDFEMVRLGDPDAAAPSADGDPVLASVIATAKTALAAGRRAT